jgi:Uma2 family endonuclease
VDPRGFWPGPPDLAVEVLSPEDRPSDCLAKVDEYLLSGVPLVLVVDPDMKTVTAYRRSAAPITLRSGADLLDLDEIIPGFGCRLRDIFG